MAGVEVRNQVIRRKRQAVQIDKGGRLGATANLLASAKGHSSNGVETRADAIILGRAMAVATFLAIAQPRPSLVP